MQAPNHLLVSRHSLAVEFAGGYGITVQQAEPIFDPPCDCAECQFSYRDRSAQTNPIFMYAGSLSKSQARDIVNRYADQITKDCTYLRDMINQYGDVILREWKGRSESDRAALLADANPALPKKRPARVHLEYANITGAEHRQKFRLLDLAPYLDVQTLSKNPAAVISLLEYRTQYSPEQWAPFDQQQLNTAWCGGMLLIHFSKEAVKIFGSDYGALVPWEAAAAHRGDIVGFPRARLLLEAQSYIMGFLRKIVSAILEGSETKKIAGNKKWRQFVQKGLERSIPHSYWSHFAISAFSAPPNFDVDDLLTRAEACLNATADHLELMQTEPAYMRRYVGIIGQMQSIDQNRNNAIVSKIISDEIIGDIEVHWSWLETCEEIRHLRTVYRQHGHLVLRGEPLPTEIDDALGALEMLLVNAAHLHSLRLQAIISQRPGFKRWYDCRQYDAKTRFAGYTLKCSEDSSVIFKKDPLWWALMQLQGDPEDHTRFPYSTMFEFLDDHLASTTSNERTRLDEILYDKLSDYATILIMLQAVRLHYPKCTIRNLHEITQKDDRLAWRRHKAKKTPRPDATAAGIRMKEFMRTRLPSGPRNAEWVESLTNSHRALQKYWRSVHNHLITLNKTRELSEQDNRELLQPIEHWSSEKYRDLLAAEQERIQQELSRAKPSKNLNENTFLPLPSGPDLITRPKLPEPRAKEKTRSAADFSLAPTADTAIQDQVRPVTIPLTKRSIKTLGSLFPSSHEERSRTVPWDTFVLFMEDAGFKARSGGGSIFIFEKIEGAGKINFHRPHPDPTLDPIMLQTIGRRMNKWFGWTRGIFQPAVKQS